MRRFVTTFVGTVLVAMPRVALTQQFEGVITQRTITVDRYALADQGVEVSESNLDIPIERLLALRSELEASGEMTVDELEIQIKGNLVRADVQDEEGPAYATMDSQSGAMRLFRPAERMYIEWSREDLEQMRAYSGGGSLPAPSAHPTGLTRTINGMEATAYDVTTDGGITRVWVSRDDARLADAFRSYAERASALSSMGDEDVDAALVVAKHGFPVLEQQLNHDFYEVVEVRAVERRAISGDVFDPPPGYRKMTMSEMMGGMMEAGATRGGPDGPPPGLGVGRGSGSSVWVEYAVTGSVDANGREEDVAMCSETSDGLLARTLGEWIIDLEADGSGPGRHAARFTVTAPDWVAARHEESFRTNERLSGDGTITVVSAGTDANGFDLIRIEFSASGLMSDAGGEIDVRGTISCQVL